MIYIELFIALVKTLPLQKHTMTHTANEGIVLTLDSWESNLTITGHFIVIYDYNEKVFCLYITIGEPVFILN
ncbi:hypothetical protein [Anaerotignum sp.]|uniref:hypothetical protein n=1 Tax=Anaerotignum sp. TaxID=2039241 RepID=UPI0028B0C546|nr:hypothetical protein [Anaerotignum sp.]